MAFCLPTATATTTRALALLIITASASGFDSFNPKATNNHPKLRRRLQQGDEISTIEYCGQCIWQGNIVCEARAQFLVKQNGSTLQDARISILDDCKADGSEQVKLSLDAFCGTCPWQSMNFNCDARAQFLVENYKLTDDKAKEGILEKGECVDPNYVPPSTKAEGQEVEESSLSNGAIVGIVLGITAFLLCLIICLWATRFRNKEESEETALPTGDAADSSEAKESALPMSIAAPRRNSKRAKKRDRSDKKTISFAIDKPDPPGESKCAPDEYDDVITTSEEEGLSQEKSESADTGNNISEIKPMDSTDAPEEKNEISGNDPPTEDDVMEKREVAEEPATNDDVSTTKENTTEDGSDPNDKEEAATDVVETKYNTTEDGSKAQDAADDSGAENVILKNKEITMDKEEGLSGEN